MIVNIELIPGVAEMILWHVFCNHTRDTIVARRIAFCLIQTEHSLDKSILSGEIYT